MDTFQHRLRVDRALLLGTLSCAFVATAVHADQYGHRGEGLLNVQIASDLDSADNTFIQPQEPALAGGGRDQSLQFGDIIRGSHADDLQIGGLGIDLMAGGYGDDVMIGGLEHFNPLNRDRALGGSGSDIFIWKPGDGSDLFEGGYGHDVMIFGNVGEVVDGRVDFSVSMDQQAGEVAIDPATGLPRVDVSGSPGFCDVIDDSSSAEAALALDDLQLDQLVRFTLRGVRAAFDAGEQAEDNGLRVTVHLKDVETLVCTSREGGAIEVLDLTTSPPTPTTIEQLRYSRLRDRLNNMVF